MSRLQPTDEKLFYLIQTNARKTCSQVPTLFRLINSYQPKSTQQKTIIDLAQTAEITQLLAIVSINISIKQQTGISLAIYSR